MKVAAKFGAPGIRDQPQADIGGIAGIDNFNPSTGNVAAYGNGHRRILFDHRSAGGYLAGMAESIRDDFFDLFDLRVEVVAPIGARLWCGSKIGDYFDVHGEMLHFQPGMMFSLYSLAAILPLLPAKQRPTSAQDWMTTDAEIACPDPNCPSRLRITRRGLRRFRHGDTTATVLKVE